MVVDLYVLMATLKGANPSGHDGEYERATGANYGVLASGRLQALIILGAASDH